MNQKILADLTIKTESKIILIVIDGLGGLPHPELGKTELEVAKTPNLDMLARKSVCGMIDPIAKGIIPGSAPAHLALFGYDPIQYKLGRGVLAAMGIGFPLEPTDVVARGNFATINDKGVIVDRRAGRISTEENKRLCKLLEGIEIEGAHIFVKPVREHRVAVIFRGENLSGELTDSDPQRNGLFPLVVNPLNEESERASRIVNKFLFEAKRRLKGQYPANMLILRGFSKHTTFPTFDELYKLRAAAVATYPMYIGIARLVGMRILSPKGEEVEDEFGVLRENFEMYDFFYIHFKKTDSLGEDGSFEEKVSLIQEIDSKIPILLELNPDVIIVTGDHSTPSTLRAHSWHPLPILIYSPNCRPDRVTMFKERHCIYGALGRFRATEVMALALANAGKLTRYGA
jgi:2,3-bisphosphoglycerate-independent phosphoglycerate mutase